MCTHKTNNNDGQEAGVYPDLSGMYQHGQDTHQADQTGAESGNVPAFSELIIQLMRETERYIREQQQADQQSNNNNNATPSAPPQPGHGHGGDQEQQQQHQGQQHIPRQHQSYDRTPHQRYNDFVNNPNVQDIMTGFQNFSAVFGKTMMQVIAAVLIMWIFTHIPTCLIFLVAACSLDLNIGTMIAGYLLMNFINSCPPLLLAALGYWAFYRKIILGKPLFTCKKWEQFQRRHYEQKCN